MFLQLKNALVITIAATVVVAPLCNSLELEPIAKYEGHHSSKCMKQQKLTGTLVHDTIYTFGGCFPLAYIIDPENDAYYNPFSKMPHEKYNTTDDVYAYDIEQDTWTLVSHTPVPLYDANLQVVHNDVYVFDVQQAEPDRKRSVMWKYATDTNTWQVVNTTLPFIWRSQLISCEHDGIIYFVGSQDGDIRNIIQRYAIADNTWMSPLFLDKTLYTIDTMFCTSESIQFVGTEQIRNVQEQAMAFMTNEDYAIKAVFYTTSYYDGTTRESGFNRSMAWDAEAVSHGDWLYLYDVSKTESTFTKVNPLTKETIHLGTIKETLKNSLFIPYQDKVAYLFGGDGAGNPMFFGASSVTSKSKNGINTYHHKVSFIEETADEQQIVI